jgi:hypothetical protein
MDLLTFRSIAARSFSTVKHFKKNNRAGPLTQQHSITSEDTHPLTMECLFKENWY